MTKRKKTKEDISTIYNVGDVVNIVPKNTSVASDLGT